MAKFKRKKKEVETFLEFIFIGIIKEMKKEIAKKCFQYGLIYFGFWDGFHWAGKQNEYPEKYGFQVYKFI